MPYVTGACRSEIADKEQQEDSPDAVAQALARAEAQSDRGSGLHCNPIFADALHRSQQAGSPPEPLASHNCTCSSLSIWRCSVITQISGTDRPVPCQAPERWCTNPETTCDASKCSRLSRPSLQEVQNLLEKEAVRCIIIQDNPTFDSLRCSLGLPRSHLTSASQPSDCQLALQVQP